MVNLSRGYLNAATAWIKRAATARSLNSGSCTVTVGKADSGGVATSALRVRQ